MRVEVVDGNEDLAKTGLSEVLRQQLGVAAGKFLGTWSLELRGAAHQIEDTVRRIAKMGRAAVDSNTVFIDDLWVPDEDRIGEPK